MISLARSSQSADKLAQKLLSEDWLPPGDPKAKPFIDQLYAQFSVKKEPTQVKQRKSDLEKVKELTKRSNYKMLKDEDIIGHEDLDEEDADEAAIAVPDKWAKLEADLKKIKDKTAQGDEIQTLR